MKTIRAIFFDLDGTLYDETSAYEYALNAVGLHSDDPAYRRSRLRVKALLGKNHPSARNRLLYLKQFLTERGRYSPARVLSMMQRYENALRIHIQRQWRRLKRDALMRSLARRYRLVVITNENTRTQLVKMSAIDPNARYFHDLITSEEVGVEKPSPHIFRAALRQCGLRSSCCLMVGNHYGQDIAPALSLGFRAALSTEFANSGKTSSRPQHLDVIDKLDRLPLLLDR